MRSATEPAAKLQMARISRDGYSCAAAEPTASHATTARQIFIMKSLAYTESPGGGLHASFVGYLSHSDLGGRRRGGVSGARDHAARRLSAWRRHGPHRPGARALHREEPRRQREDRGS